MVMKNVLRWFFWTISVLFLLFLSDITHWSYYCFDNIGDGQYLYSCTTPHNQYIDSRCFDIYINNSIEIRDIKPEYCPEKIIIPNQINKRPVTSINLMYDDIPKNISSLTIPKTIEKIENMIYADEIIVISPKNNYIYNAINASKIIIKWESVIIWSNLIGKNIQFDESVKDIYFDDKYELLSRYPNNIYDITLPKTVEKIWMDWGQWTVKLNIKWWYWLKEIWDNVQIVNWFGSNKKFWDILVLPDTIEYVWKNTFKNKYLKSVKFPKNVYYIWGWAFCNETLIEIQKNDIYNMKEVEKFFNIWYMTIKESDTIRTKVEDSSNISDRIIDSLNSSCLYTEKNESNLIPLSGFWINEIGDIIEIYKIKNYGWKTNYNENVDGSNTDQSNTDQSNTSQSNTSQSTKLKQFADYINNITRNYEDFYVESQIIENYSKCRFSEDPLAGDLYIIRYAKEFQEEYDDLSDDDKNEVNSYYTKKYGKSLKSTISYYSNKAKFFKEEIESNKKRCNEILNSEREKQQKENELQNDDLYIYKKIWENFIKYYNEGLYLDAVLSYDWLKEYTDLDELFTNDELKDMENKYNKAKSYVYNWITKRDNSQRDQEILQYKDALYKWLTKKRADLYVSIWEIALNHPKRENVKRLAYIFKSNKDKETRLVWDYLYALLN